MLIHIPLLYSVFLTWDYEMIIAEIKDDVFADFSAGKFNAFVHGCNCFCTMGAGVALAVKRLYVEAYVADLKTVKGDVSKLGTYTSADFDAGKIINLYTQFNYAFGKINADYDAIAAGFKLLNEDFKGQSLCTVRIGAGLAGGDWEIIKRLINESTPDVDITVYYI